MGIQFVFGPSGSGKSTYVQKELINEAGKNRHRNYFLIVPDQYTMQTQFEMATRHPDGGILNIDVLSFGRLKHSVFEEVGKDSRIPLDDTGKCLILRKIMGEQKDNLKVLKKNIKNPGCVEEIKSVICEFMQYGLEPADLEDFMKEAGRHQNFIYKLKDLKLLYEAFLQECREKYLTSEESLNLLCARLPLSRRFRDSVIAFDGFTGFTPIQLNVILTLAHVGKEVMVTLPFDGRYNPHALYPEDFFLHLTQKTVRALQKRAEEEKIPISREVMLPGNPVYRYSGNPELSHLEHNLFRQEATAYIKEGTGNEGSQGKKCRSIEIVKAGNVEQECRLACEWIFKQVNDKEQGLRYRDIAVITGDMNLYREPLKKFFTRYQVPYFMDSTVNMLKNPFIQFLRAALNLFLYDFSYRDCMTFLRSGYTDFTREEVDRFDNYLRAKGIRGAGAFRKPFQKPSRALMDKTEEFEAINATRERFIHMFDRFGHSNGNTEKPAKEWAEIFYYFLTDLKLQEKLNEQSETFIQAGDMARGKEFGQLGRYVIELLDQIAGLLNEEPISLRAFAEILEAGYGEIRIGILPQGVDVLVVGDMQRTRLNEVKALLFIGLNDGNIPKAVRQGGIISDLERDLMKKAGKELAPTPAQQIFIERLYLYLTVTKPKERLYLSYSSISESGEKKQPSYFIKTVKELFPSLTEQHREREIPFLSIADEKEQFARKLSRYASGMDKDGELAERLMDYYGDFLTRDSLGNWPQEMVENAFTSYLPKPLRKELAMELYGNELGCSASSLERFAACQYSHFLEYGLHLMPREEASFERVDYGNLNHEFLQRVENGLLADGKLLADITAGELQLRIESVLKEFVEEDKWGIFEENMGGNFFASQVDRLMNRSLMTMKVQLSHGDFIPKYFERSFHAQLAGKEKDYKILLKGKIDRIDLCEKDGKIYVKIVDYKSSNKEFKMDLFEMGLQIQLALYMKEAVESMKREKRDMEVVPAAMLYYHVKDPFIAAEEGVSDSDLERARLEKLRPAGILSNDPAVIDLMDKGLTEKSLVIPAKMEKGVVDSSSCVEPDYLERMLNYVRDLVTDLSDEIYQGKKAVNPVMDGNKFESCHFCNFREICPYDDKIQGYKPRKVEKAKGITPKEKDGK